MIAVCVVCVLVFLCVDSLCDFLLCFDFLVCFYCVPSLLFCSCLKFGRSLYCFGVGVVSVVFVCVLVCLCCARFLSFFWRVSVLFGRMLRFRCCRVCVLFVFVRVIFVCVVDAFVCVVFFFFGLFA